MGGTKRRLLKTSALFLALIFMLFFVAPLVHAADTSPAALDPIPAPFEPGVVPQEIQPGQEPAFEEATAQEDNGPPQPETYPAEIGDVSLADGEPGPGPADRWMEIPEREVSFGDEPGPRDTGFAWKGRRAAPATDENGREIFRHYQVQTAFEILPGAQESLPGPRDIPEQTLTDQLEDNFELVAGSLFLSDAEGMPLPETSQPTWAQGLISWTVPPDLPGGGYALHYTVRVKEDPAQPNRYYPEGAAGQAISRTVEFRQGEAQALQYVGEGSVVDVPPLLSVSAPDVPALAGGDTNLTGTVNHGNGSYTYAWYDAKGGELDSGTMPVASAQTAKGRGDSVPVPPCTVQAGAGESVFYLEVTDNWAWNGGYSGGRQRIPVYVTGVEASLTIRVTGKDGADLSGEFEVTARKLNEDAPDEQYHYFGPGEVTYTCATGLTQGQYEIFAYTPYGYRVTAQNRQSVLIAPVPQEAGGWEACQETVTIEISPTHPGYFFDWLWSI